MLDKERIIPLINEHIKIANDFGLLECNLWSLSEIMYSHFREERKYLLEEIWTNQQEFEKWMRSEERKQDASYKYLMPRNVLFVAYVDVKLAQSLSISTH